uniref:Uncharacterized protein n=1 Tax=Anguilla anguilla TaxID=7936 RepID=A0A0E9T5P5_ANGAN
MYYKEALKDLIWYLGQISKLTLSICLTNLPQCS